MNMFVDRRSATFIITLVNVILFILELLGGFTTTTLLKLGAQYGPMVDAGQYYRLITAMFLHGGFLHIFFNMYALLYLGNVVERVYSTPKFLSVYFFSGVVGNLATQIFYHNTISIGASGAIFGLVGMLFAAGRRHDIPYYLKPLTGAALLPMILVNLVLGFTAGNINNAAHIGGLLAGMAFGLLVSPRYTWRSWRRWIVVMYIITSLMIASFLLLFLNPGGNVSEIIDFHNRYLRILGKLKMGQLVSIREVESLKPVDWDTRKLKRKLLSHLETMKPPLEELERDFQEWHNKILDMYKGLITRK